MQSLAAYQIKRGHLLVIGDDREEVLDVETHCDGDGVTLVGVLTRDLTRMVPVEHIFKRHDEVFVE